MRIKILLISTVIITFIKIIDGINSTWEKDDQNLFFSSNGASNKPPSSDEEMLREFFGNPVNQINEEIHGESGTVGIQNVPMDEKTREKWAQNTFFQEYQLMNKSWDELRNESYDQTWPILCYLLWAKKLDAKRGQECSANGIYSPLFSYTYRVHIPNNKTYNLDVLKCKCPENSNLPLRHQKISYSGLFFFVSPCDMYPNSYYIMRQPRRALEVYDIRNTTFNPATDYNFSALAYLTDEYTYGQPGTTGSRKELEDTNATEKKAKNTFVTEYKKCRGEMIWVDLRNKTYEHSWPKLCFLLCNKEADKNTGQKCKSKLLSRFYNRYITHRVVHKGLFNNMYVDLLLCTCTKSIPFYVTKSCKIDNTYYLLRLIGREGGACELEVYDMHSVVFNPTSSNTQ